MTNIFPKVERVGLAVMRLQPVHRGHLRVINRMIRDCPTAIVCIGSAQISRERHNPYTVEERMQMLKNVYGDRLKIIPLNDIGAQSPSKWVEYIEEKIQKVGMKPATDYYTGSIQDGSWYKDHFYNEELVPFEEVWTEPFSSAMSDTMAPYYINGVLKNLHILDRNVNAVPPATDIRGFLELRNDGWKEWTPAVNHDIIDDNYPNKLKVPLD